MKKFLKYSKNLNLDNNRNYILNYYITFKFFKNNNYIYGIEIQKCKKSDTNFEVIEIEKVDNVTYNYNKINKIIDIISKNLVTPITLVYILDDIIENID